MKRLAAVSLILICLVNAQQAPMLPVKLSIVADRAYSYGEKLTYRAHYGVLNAATITMEVLSNPEKVNGAPAYHIKGTGITHAGYDWFFPVQDYYESYIDLNSLLPQKYVRNVREGGYKDSEFATFDHKRKKVYSSKGSFEADSAFQDVLSAIYYLRNANVRDLNVGQYFDLTFYLDKQVYTTRVKYAGKEVISTDLGKFNALIFKPKVLVDRVFPNEDALTVWVTDDANLIPLRIKTELMVGSLKADITSISGERHFLSSKLR